MIKRIVLRAAAVVATLIILAFAYVGLTIWRAGRGLPEWDGKVEVGGRDGPTAIVRDEYGVPYIRASSERDLYFAQGFVHAQDRFWQMTLMRRRSAGCPGRRFPGHGPSPQPRGERCRSAGSGRGLCGPAAQFLLCGYRREHRLPGRRPHSRSSGEPCAYGRARSRG